MKEEKKKTQNIPPLLSLSSLKSLHFFNGRLNVKRELLNYSNMDGPSLFETSTASLMNYIYPYVCGQGLLAQGHATKSGTGDVLNMHLDIQSASALARVVNHTHTHTRTHTYLPRVHSGFAFVWVRFIMPSRHPLFTIAVWVYFQLGRHSAWDERALHQQDLGRTVSFQQEKTKKQKQKNVLPHCPFPSRKHTCVLHKLHIIVAALHIHRGCFMPNSWQHSTSNSRVTQSFKYLSLSPCAALCSVPTLVYYI